MARPDRDTMLRALELSARAPSVHNTQPWRWLLGSRSIHLMADWSRHLPATDPGRRDLLISCGAALHHLRVALAALGWAALVHRLPNPAEPSHLAAVETHPHEPGVEDIELAEAIPHRRTDRGRYSCWPVPAGHLALLADRAEQEGVRAVSVTDPITRHRLAEAIAEASARRQSDPDHPAELPDRSRHDRATEDGMFATTVPTRADGTMDVRMRALAERVLSSPPDAGRRPAAELIVLATATDDVLSRLRAGEAASTVLLTATSLSLAGCVLSQPLEFADTRARIRHRLLGDTGFPQLVIRVGWRPASAAPLPVTPRRAVRQIVDYLPGTRRLRDG